MQLRQRTPRQSRRRTGWLSLSHVSGWGAYSPILIGCLVVFGGCVSDRVSDGSKVSTYQKRLAGSGPQQRLNAQEPPSLDPLSMLKPVETEQEAIPPLQIIEDPNNGEKTATLTIEQAITRALANSPEIRIVSFDPEIARQEVAKAAGDFDPTAFSRVNYDDQDNPRNSFFEPGEAETRLFESGVKQRTILGSEWSASYGLSHIWDDLSYRATYRLAMSRWSSLNFASPCSGMPARR